MVRKVDGPEITGQVTHKQTGQVYGGVTVTVSPKVYTDPEMTASVTSLTTDGTGVFSCYAPPGNYTFSTTAVDAQTLEPVEVLGREGGTGVATAASGGSVAPVPLGQVAAAGTSPTFMRADAVLAQPTWSERDGFVINYRPSHTSGQQMSTGPDIGAAAFSSLGFGRAIPVYWTRSVNVQIGTNVTGVGAAGCVLRLILWLADGTNDAPGTLVSDLGTVVADVGTGVKYAATTVAVTRGVRYWAGVVQQVATGASADAAAIPPWVLPVVPAVGAFNTFSYRLNIPGAAASNPSTVTMDAAGFVVYSKIV